MFKDKIKKISEKLFKSGNTNKRNIENLMVLLALLVITLIAIKQIWGDKKVTQNNDMDNSYKILATEEKTTYENSNISENSEYNLEEKLEDILSDINGVGSVRVLISYSESTEKVAMQNEKQTTSITEETDAEGGKRTIESTDVSTEVVFEDSNGSNIAIIEKIIMPKVEGAIVIANGAGNAGVKTNIIQAVSAVTGIATYKVQVFEMKN